MSFDSSHHVVLMVKLIPQRSRHVEWERITGSLKNQCKRRNSGHTTTMREVCQSSALKSVCRRGPRVPWHQILDRIDSISMCISSPCLLSAAPGRSPPSISCIHSSINTSECLSRPNLCQRCSSAHKSSDICRPLLLESREFAAQDEKLRRFWSEELSSHKWKQAPNNYSHELAGSHDSFSSCRRPIVCKYRHCLFQHLK